MRIATIAVLVIVVSAGAALARLGPPTPRLPDFAYSVALRNYDRDAVCVARGGNTATPKRLAGLGEFQGFDWSPDGNRFAAALHGATGAIRVGRADGSGALRRVTSPRRNEGDSSPEWSPDGSLIAFSRYVYYVPGEKYRRFGLRVVNVTSRREHQLTRGSVPLGYSWSPSGDRLAVMSFGHLDLFTAGGRRVWTLSGSQQEPAAVAWSPKGDLIAARFGPTVLLLTPDEHVIATISLPAGELTPLESGLSWSPDGQRLAVGGGAIYDRSGQPAGRYGPATTMSAVSFAPVWAPDDSAIVFQQARPKWSVGRYTRFLTRGPADLYLSSPSGAGPAALTATPSFDEGEPVFRPGQTGGAAGTGAPCFLLGTEGRDVLRGTSQPDLVDAGGGADAVYGNGGNDLILGGRGADVIKGGRGHDMLLGGAGNDTLFSRDRESDAVYGDSGHDRAVVDRKLDRVTGVERVYRR